MVHFMRVGRGWGRVNLKGGRHDLSCSLQSPGHHKPCKIYALDWPVTMYFFRHSHPFDEKDYWLDPSFQDFGVKIHVVNICRKNKLCSTMTLFYYNLLFYHKYQLPNLQSYQQSRFWKFGFIKILSVISLYSMKIWTIFF